MAPKRIIPLTALDQIILEAGCQFADFEAITELGSILESVAIEIIKIALKLAQHANRKTLVDADVKLAHEQWLNLKVKS